MTPLHPTGLYLTAASDHSHDFIYYRRGSAASHLNRTDIDEHYIKGAQVLHVSGISQAIGDSCQDAIFQALVYGKKHELEISYDFNFRPALWDVDYARQVALGTIKEFASIVCITREEIGLLGYGDSYEKAVEDFLQWGVRLVAVKLGDKGCHLFDGVQSVFAPSYPVEVADTVGAGDAFAAAIVCGILENMSLEKLASFANLVAALTCRGAGPVQKQPFREEVDPLLA